MATASADGAPIYRIGAARQRDAPPAGRERAGDIRAPYAGAGGRAAAKAIAMVFFQNSRWRARRGGHAAASGAAAVAPVLFHAAYGARRRRNYMRTCSKSHAAGGTAEIQGAG